METCFHCPFGRLLQWSRPPQSPQHPHLHFLAPGAPCPASLSQPKPPWCCLHPPVPELRLWIAACLYDYYHSPSWTFQNDPTLFCYPFHGLCLFPTSWPVWLMGGLMRWRQRLRYLGWVTVRRGLYFWFEQKSRRMIRTGPFSLLYRISFWGDVVQFWEWL